MASPFVPASPKASKPTSTGCLCDRCAALCCRYFALPIDNPKTLRQFDDIRWYLIHENVIVYIQKRQWHLGVLNPCKHLGADNRCGIYETRPRICREYTTDNCDWHGGDYDFEKLFTSAEQLEEYVLEKLGKPLALPPARKKKPVVRVKLNGNGRHTVSLPVVQS